LRSDVTTHAAGRNFAASCPCQGYPHPLNFARTFVRELVQGRWQL